MGPVPCRGPPHAGLCAGIEDLLGAAVDNLIGPRLILAQLVQRVKSLLEKSGLVDILIGYFSVPMVGFPEVLRDLGAFFLLPVAVGLGFF